MANIWWAYVSTVSAPLGPLGTVNSWITILFCSLHHEALNGSWFMAEDLFWLSVRYENTQVIGAPVQYLVLGRGIRPPLSNEKPTATPRFNQQIVYTAPSTPIQKKVFRRLKQLYKCTKVLAKTKQRPGRNQGFGFQWLPLASPDTTCYFGPWPRDAAPRCFWQPRLCLINGGWWNIEKAFWAVIWWG